MSYAKFRASLSNLEYVDDIYMEIREVGAKHAIVGFFDVDETAAIPAQIPQSRATYWQNSALRFDVMNRLNLLHPAHFVFCDAGMNEFQLHSSPFTQSNYQCFNEATYINFLQNLRAVRPKNTSAQKPKHPGALSLYSQWHYDLDQVYKCRDIDYLEMRDGQIKAILEVTGNLDGERHLQNSLKYIFNRWGLHQEIFRFLGAAIKVPTFFVVHTEQLDVFYVFDAGFNRLLRADQAGYAAWLSRL